MFSGGIAPQQPPVINSSSFFGDSLNSLLFSNPENSQFGLHQLLSQKNKLKRCRQRVDAGEPRNTYHNQLRMNGYKRERSSSATSENGFGIKLNDFENEPEDILASKPKRIKVDDEEDQNYTDVDQKEIDEMLKEQKSDDQNYDIDSVQQCHSNTSSISNSSSRRKSFHPQRQITDQTNNMNDNEFNHIESVGGDPEEASIVGGNESPVEFPDENETTTEQSSKPSSTTPNNSNYLLNMMNIFQQQNQNNQSNQQPITTNNNNGTSKLQELLEAQRRFHINNLSESKESSSTIPSHLSQFQQQQSQEFNNSVNRLKQNLRDEIGTVIEKVVQEYRMQELRKLMENVIKTVQLSTDMQQQQMNDMKQQQQRFAAAAAASFLMPKSVGYGSGNHANPMSSFNSSAVSNFLAAAAAANQNNSNSSNCNNSIFPTSQNLANLSAITSQLNNNHLLRTSTSTNDCSLRKKRSKVTDSLRINKTGIVRDSSSLPTSERSSPLTNNYFPPTMVSHPLYNSSFTNDDRNLDDSAENSDNYSDTGPYDSNISQSSTLTPIHLRKAKLMFFYTRYPSSALLKSYFPDIRFNKNNTAQLVKWFSNFREFFYMQMEKFAKQALMERIEDRSQIIVTEDSEIFKTLNQHYNRNNLFPPPPRLRYVIEETLREFFTALQQKRDSEPSWKKAIYKIINQMDDPIPEHFKHPSFMNSLE